MVGKPVEVVITSSPGCSARSFSRGEVSVAKATRLADDPEFTVRTCLRPSNEPSFSSNALLNRPVVNQKSRAESTRFRTSEAANTRPDTGTGDAPGTNCGDAAAA